MASSVAGAKVPDFQDYRIFDVLCLVQAYSIHEMGTKTETTVMISSFQLPWSDLLNCPEACLSPELNGLKHRDTLDDLVVLPTGFQIFF